MIITNVMNFSINDINKVYAFNFDHFPQPIELTFPLSTPQLFEFDKILDGLYEKDLSNFSPKILNVIALYDQNNFLLSYGYLTDPLYVGQGIVEKIKLHINISQLDESNEVSYLLDYYYKLHSNPKTLEEHNIYPNDNRTISEITYEKYYDKILNPDTSQYLKVNIVSQTNNRIYDNKTLNLDEISDIEPDHRWYPKMPIYWDPNLITDQINVNNIINYNTRLIFDHTRGLIVLTYYISGSNFYAILYGSGHNKIIRIYILPVNSNLSDFVGQLYLKRLHIYDENIIININNNTIGTNIENCLYVNEYPSSIYPDVKIIEYNNPEIVYDILDLQTSKQYIPEDFDLFGGLYCNDTFVYYPLEFYNDPYPAINKCVLFAPSENGEKLIKQIIETHIRYLKKLEFPDSNDIILGLTNIIYKDRYLIYSSPSNRILPFDLKFDLNENTMKYYESNNLLFEFTINNETIITNLYDNSKITLQGIIKYDRGIALKLTSTSYEYITSGIPI